MTNKRYKPLFDKLFYITSVLTFILVVTPTVVCGIHAPSTLFITLPVFLFTAYFFISPLFAYAELGEDALFIKYGLMISHSIPYNKIRAIKSERGMTNHSILSIKNALVHTNIKYNTFDETTLSLKEMDEFLRDLNEKCDRRLL